MQKNNSLGDKFAGFSSKPDPKVWENIERSLDEKPRRKGFVWWWTALAASFVVGMLVWNFQGDVSTQSSKYTSKNNLGSEEMNQKTVALDSNKQVVENKSFVPNTSQNQQLKKEQTKSESFEKNIDQPKKQFASKTNSDTKIPTKPLVDKFVKSEIPNNESPSRIAIETFNESTNNLNSIEPKDSSLAEEANNIEAAIDSSIVSQEEVDLELEPHEAKKSNWQLQFLFGGFASQKYEVINPTLNQYLPSSNEITSGISNGIYNEPIENPAVYKYYRNVISQFGFLTSYNTTTRWRFTSGVSFLRYYTYNLDDRELISGAHFIQIPMLVDFKLIHKPKWEWSLGTGAGLGYVFEKQSNTQVSKWRSDLIAQTSLRYSISERWIVQCQPQARFVFWDSQIGKVDKLGPWHWGGNIGVIWNF